MNIKDVFIVPVLIGFADQGGDGESGKWIGPFLHAGAWDRSVKEMNEESTTCTLKISDFVTLAIYCPFLGTSCKKSSMKWNFSKKRNL